MLSMIVRWTPALVWMVLIFALSSRQAFQSPGGIMDTLAPIIAHLLLFGVLSVLLAWAIDANRTAVPRSAILAVALAVLYGITDEMHQSFVPGRDASLFDIGVDFAGAAAATRLWVRRGKRRARLRWRRA